MPDAKNEAQAIAQDLTAAGFTVSLKSMDWKAGYYNECYVGHNAMFLLGWTADWPAPNNFLVTAFFGYVGGKPATQFGYKNDAVNTLFGQALAARPQTRPTPSGARHRMQSQPICRWFRSSTRLLRELTAEGSRFRRGRQRHRLLQHRLAPVANSSASSSGQQPGRLDFIQPKPRHNVVVEPPGSPDPGGL